MATFLHNIHIYVRVLRGFFFFLNLKKKIQNETNVIFKLVNYTDILFLNLRSLFIQTEKGEYDV